MMSPMPSTNGSRNECVLTAQTSDGECVSSLRRGNRVVIVHGTIDSSEVDLFDFTVHKAQQCVVLRIQIVRVQRLHTRTQTGECELRGAEVCHGCLSSAVIVDLGSGGLFTDVHDAETAFVESETDGVPT